MSKILKTEYFYTQPRDGERYDNAYGRQFTYQHGSWSYTMEGGMHATSVVKCQNANKSIGRIKYL